MTYLAFAKTFGPYFAIGALLMVVLFYRGDMIKAKAAKEQAVAEAVSLRTVNEANSKAMKLLSESQAQNTQILKDLGLSIAEIDARRDATRTVIKESIRNDPAVKSWADGAIPGRVRDALNSRAVPSSR